MPVTRPYKIKTSIYIHFHFTSVHLNCAMAHTNTEKFCLNWNDFSKNTTSFFKELRGDQESSDVTLVSSDGEEIEAHKVILASGSGFFQNLFKQSVKKTSHPLLYMRGLKTTELNLIVDFLYQGEVNVPQDQLEDFLALATELQLKGLSTGGSGPEIAPHSDFQDYEKDTQKGEKWPAESRKLKSTDIAQSSPTQLSHERTLSIQEGGDSRATVLYQGNNLELDQKIDSMMERVEGTWRCKVCGKKDALKPNIKKHIDGVHIDGYTHPCVYCAKNFRSRNSLQNHVSNNHRNSSKDKDIYFSS